ncbi:MAG: hypothetical protein ACTHK8_05505 [Ginsengibacter sp.]
MKELYSIKKNSLLLIFLVIVGPIILPSCSHKLIFQKSYSIPDATGYVKFKKETNDNYRVDVKTVNLPKPKDLTPPGDVYVVWMRTRENDLTNIGRIKSASGLFSKKLKGELKATALSRPISFFITAERYGDIQYPNNHVVLSTK